jgi:hypothetical protein
VIALVVAGVALTLIFERHVARTIADDLDVHLKQLLAASKSIPKTGSSSPDYRPIRDFPILCRASIGRSATIGINSCDRGHSGT